jgi:hypothetical protein
LQLQGMMIISSVALYAALFCLFYKVLVLHRGIVKRSKTCNRNNTYVVYNNYEEDNILLGFNI